MDRWRNDAVSSTNHFSRPFLGLILCEHSGSDIFGRLQNTLEGIICDGSVGLLPGWRSFCEVNMATKPLQLFWMSLKLLKSHKAFTFTSYWPNRGDRNMFASSQQIVWNQANFLHHVPNVPTWELRQKCLPICCQKSNFCMKEWRLGFVRVDSILGNDRLK